MDQDKVFKFLEELTELSKKHGIYLASEHEDSLYMPYLTDEAVEGGSYKVDIDLESSHYGPYGKFCSLNYRTDKKCSYCPSSKVIVEYYSEHGEFYSCGNSSCLKRAGRDKGGIRE